jgi:hypothetical protein
VKQQVGKVEEAGIQAEKLAIEHVADLVCYSLPGAFSM